jgi:hypothetical protein
MFIDTESPIFASILAKLVRATRKEPDRESTITFSEMLPGLDETWLANAAGERFTSELRIVAVDARGREGTSR